MNDDGGDGPGATARRVPATRLRGAGTEATLECVAEEAAVAIEVNGIAHAVMLATPADLEDFALGFLLGEGLVDAPGDLLDVEVEPVGDDVALKLEVTQRCLHRFKERRRALAGRTGCGLCGTESIDEVNRPVARVESALVVERAALVRAMRALGEGQSLQRATGATHAAAWLDGSGALVAVREDVGRHNALDKLCGWLARSGLDPAAGFVAVTSRASYEMVMKTASARCPLIAAISAPTARAVRSAEASGVTLVGFARGEQSTVYAHPARIGP